MIPRIHQFWPHSYPRHQRRQSQRSSSEVGKSPLASTHIGDQLVLTPHDDKFPPPRRKNLSAVAPSRDPKANHTQRHYKSSIPNRFDIFHTKQFFTSSIIIHETLVKIINLSTNTSNTYFSPGQLLNSQLSMTTLEVGTNPTQHLRPPWRVKCPMVIPGE